ncbi:hypothetical protein A2335_01440 [Candidatus Peregrinibacteria bacterium RIFOXYB2_FULL_32_7]|nr:MAG: hypothetical protein A2335_01440 [Candidatus Peregrinibacteria bacterium RIFOXYB2_FULL_32_7]
MDGFRHDFVETLAKAKMESLNKEISPRFRITTGNSNNYYIEMLKLDQIKSTQESDWMPIIGFELDMINKNGQIALAPSSHKTFLKKTLPLRGGQKPNWIKIRAEKAKFQPFADEPELLHEALKAYILQLEDITKLDPAFLFQICIENDSIIADAVKKNPQLQNTYR